MHPNAQQFKNCWVILLRRQKILQPKKKRRNIRLLEEEEIEALMNTKGGNIEIDPYITERERKQVK